MTDEGAEVLVKNVDALRAIMEALGVDTAEAALDRINWLTEEAARTTERRHLPDERPAITRKLSYYDDHGEEHGIYVTVGTFEDGRTGEVFITADRHGSTIGGLLKALSIALSIGLQYGVPLEAYCDKLRGMRFEPMGRGAPPLGEVASPVDAVARWLLQRFIGVEE